MLKCWFSLPVSRNICGMSATPYLHPTLTLHLADEAATQALAERLARYVVAGDLIRLEGDLGAGKTTFAGYFIRGMGHVGDVPSPTYTLVQTYAGTRVSLAHIDCYRLNDSTELDGLDLGTYRQFGVVLAEWPEKGGALLSADVPDTLPNPINQRELPGILKVRLEIAADGARRATLTGSTSWAWRFAFLQGLAGLPEGVVLTRPISEAGRRAFLDQNLAPGYTLTSLGGDWGGRCYAKVELADGSQQLLMDGPPPQESVVGAYAQIAEHYAAMGLRTAHTYAVDTREGYLLQEHLGHTALYDTMQAGEDTAAWFRVAGHILATQVQHHAAHGTPAWAMRYSALYWWAEAARFLNWYVPFATGKAATPEQFAQWQALWQALYTEVSVFPHGLMMWDCQSPNLMCLSDVPSIQNLALIDIQDARVAPVVQDAALLLRNIRTPQNDAVEDMVLADLAVTLKLDRTTLRHALDICSLHHSCRILGGLARLTVRDGKAAPAHAYLARTWQVAKQSFSNPALRAIADFMTPYEQPGLTQLAQQKAA